MAFGFNDEKSPLANEDVVQLCGAATAFQINVVQYHCTGKFSLQGLGYRLFGFIAEMQDPSASKCLVNRRNEKSEQYGKING